MATEALIVGCGYLGGRVAKALVGADFSVTATSRRPDGLKDMEKAGVSVVTLDLERPLDSEIWNREYDLVVYSVAPRGGDAQLAFRDGPVIVRESLRQPARTTFVYVSSTGVYSQTDGSLVNEASPAMPQNERHGFIRQAEKALMAPHDGPSAIIVRLGGLYGPGRSPMDWLRRADFRERLDGSAAAYMNWIHVEDATQTVVAAGRRGKPGEIYLGVDGTPVRRRDFYETAARLAGVEPPSLSEDSADLGKRCDNRRMLDELGVVLSYPDWRSGLSAC